MANYKKSIEKRHEKNLKGNEKMRVEQNINTYLTIKNEDGSVSNSFNFLYAKSGFGKTMNMESLIEEYHRAGYVILILSDVKDEFEFGFAMFEPEKPYHRFSLHRIGKPIQRKKVKLYHPFTFDIPTKNLLPKINFYGFSLKELHRAEWSMLAETAFESDTIRLLLNSCSNIGKNEGLFSFMHFVQDSVVGKKESRIFKPDPNNFYLSTTSATAKSLQDISSYLLPFKRHAFLVEDNSELKLDWKEILEDNESYHFFISYWIDDEKIKNFCILGLLEALVRNKKFCKHPVLIVIPEIRKIVPFKPEGYSKYLAERIKDRLSIVRNIGRGMSGVFDSQVWNDVDEDVRNSATDTFYGELGGAGDIEKLSKAMNYKREIRDVLKKMPNKGTYFVQGKEDMETFTMWLPGHMHKEEDYNFFDMYKKYCQTRSRLINETKLLDARIENLNSLLKDNPIDKEGLENELKEIEELKKKNVDFIKKYKHLELVDYNSLHDKVSEKMGEEEEKVKIRVKKKMEEEKARQEARKKERQESKEGGSKVEELKKKVSQKESAIVQEKQKAVYLMKTESPDLSWREIGKKLELHHKTASKYFEAYQLRLKQSQTETNKEDKVIESSKIDSDPEEDSEADDSEEEFLEEENEN